MFLTAVVTLYPSPPLTRMEEDNSENPLSSLQYHTLMVLGTEDYPATRSLQGSPRLPQGTGRDDQRRGGEGKERETQGSKLAADKLQDVAGVKQVSSVSNNNGPDALRQKECPAGTAPPSHNGIETLTQGTDRRRLPGGSPNAPVSLEYCSSPVPRLTDPAYDHVRGPSAPSPCPPGVASLPGPASQASSLTGSSSSSLLPSLTPQSSLSSGSHLEFSSPPSWSSVGSSRTPCVSSISSTESVRPCGWDLPPHCLYSHDKVPRPVPVAGALPGPRSSRPRRAPRPADCASSSSEKTLVGSKHDSPRLLRSGGNSASFPDTTDSTPVYENPSELDSEYYYKSPKGEATADWLVAGDLCPWHRLAGKCEGSEE